eukprot:scaffold63355_cov58-Attheya_sp.AAC.1
MRPGIMDRHIVNRVLSFIKNDDTKYTSELWDCITDHLPDHLQKEDKTLLLSNPLFGDLIVSQMNNQALLCQEDTRQDERERRRRGSSLIHRSKQYCNCKISLKRRWIM